MTTKVYVLAHERFTWDGFWSEVIGVYNTKSYAVEQMFAEEMCWCDETPHDAWVCTETNDASMYDALSGNEEDWDMEEYQNANGAAQFLVDCYVELLEQHSNDIVMS